jgi:uncharacterized protein involved in exopolysaccharide biosynthesis
MADPPHEAEGERLDLVGLLTPLVEGWKTLVIGSVGVALIAGLVVLLTPRKYRAEVALSPVTGVRQPPSSLGSLAATLAGAALTGGFQLTPQRLVELIRSRSVATRVLLAPDPTGGPGRLAERLLDDSMPPERLETGIRVLENALETGINRETGTVTLRVELADSALARAVNRLVVTEASRAFVQSAKAQASQLREAQESRVDSAQTRLSRAESAVVEFLGRNRQVSEYSIISVQRERLQREVTLAQQVYLQAAADREAAVAKELEATPTVVVLDSLPSVLPGARRHLVAKTGLTFLACALALSLWLILADLARFRLQETDPSITRFKTSLGRSPLGRLGSRGRT